VKGVLIVSPTGAETKDSALEGFWEVTADLSEGAWELDAVLEGSRLVTFGCREDFSSITGFEV
jgi:hypothetical protein